MEKEYELDREGQRIYRIGKHLSPTNEEIIDIIHVVNKHTEDLQFQTLFDDHLLPEDIGELDQGDDGTMIDFTVQCVWYDLSTEYLAAYLADDLTVEVINQMIKSNLQFYNKNGMVSVTDYNQVLIDLIHMNKNITDEIKLWFKLNY